MTNPAEMLAECERLIAKCRNQKTRSFEIIYKGMSPMTPEERVSHAERGANSLRTVNARPAVLDAFEKALIDIGYLQESTSQPLGSLVAILTALRQMAGEQATDEKKGE